MWRPGQFPALPEEVIAFVWSAPMRELAARVGISDVGLKKLLQAQGIVTPPQGHWNRIRAGRAVPAPPDPPPPGPGEPGRVRLHARFRNHIPEAPPLCEHGPFASKLVPEDLGELRARELAAIGQVAAPRDLAPTPAGLARLLRREAGRRAKALSSGWSWDEPHFDSPLAQRQLRLLAGLFRALATRGHAGEASEHDHELRAGCTIGDQTLGLRFAIVGKHRTELRSGCQRPARDLPARTPLRLVLDRQLDAGLTAAWQDSDDRPLERQLAEIAADLITAGEAAFRQGLREARERDEQFRRWEEERRREALEALGQKRLADLRTSGALLRQAEEIRTLVARVGEAARRGGAGGVSDAQLARWEAWALAQADALDPVLSGQVMAHLVVPELDADYDDSSGARGNVPDGNQQVGESSGDM